MVRLALPIKLWELGEVKRHVFGKNYRKRNFWCQANGGSGPNPFSLGQKRFNDRSKGFGQQPESA
jgi:hypothetical protein